MRARRTLLIVTGLAVAAAAVGWWRAEVSRSLIIAGVPSTPPVLNWPAEFRARLEQTSARAIGRWSPGAALGELSRLYHANGFLREAMQCYTLLEQLEPEEPRWWHRHATLQAGAGDGERALERWERVRRLAPSYVPAQLRLGDLLLKNNQPARAAAVLAEVLQREPGHPHALLGLARIDLEAGRWAEARPRLEAVVAKTNYALGYDLIVTVYEKLGETRRAMEIRGRAKASGAYRDFPDPWLDELLGDCYDVYRLALEAGRASANGNHAGAQRILERTLTLAPDDVAARFQLARVLVEQRDGSGARREFERCTVLVPGFADAWAHWAALLQQAGEAAGAERIVAAGLRACPESSGLHLMRARQLRQAGRAQEAIAAYETAIRLRPNEAEAYLELATTLFRLEEVPAGLKRLEEALAAEPEHPPTLALLAFHAITSGDETAAQGWMQRVQRQPRVAPEQAGRLQAAYRERFGRPAP